MEEVRADDRKDIQATRDNGHGRCVMIQSRLEFFRFSLHVLAIISVCSYVLLYQNEQFGSKHKKIRFSIFSCPSKTIARFYTHYVFLGVTKVCTSSEDYIGHRKDVITAHRRIFPTGVLFSQPSALMC